MKTYPTDVAQNFNVEGGGPPNYGPVAQEMWRAFGPLVEAQTGLGMIQGLATEAAMFPAELMGGKYTQYSYRDPSNGIHCRLAAGKVMMDGVELYFLEYPSDIFDRDITPMPLIDQYQAGQAHVLKALQVTPDLCQLYWAAV